MTNTSMTQAERRRRQAMIPVVHNVWDYLGGGYKTRWAQVSLTPQDVQDRIGSMDLEICHLLTPDGRSHLVIAGFNLLDDFRRFLKERAP